MANEGGGIVDDVVVTNRDDWFHLIANAGCREKDLAHLRQQLAKFSEEHGQHAAQIVPLEDRALLALQGPMAAETVQKLVGSNVDLAKLFFFYSAEMEIAGVPCLVSRSGYTGEDGFEISVHNEKAGELADALLENSCVQWAGLGARDTLRLEAGLCLYGHDLDDTTTPVEAGLLWTIGPKRRKEGGFVGADAILKQMEEGAAVQRVGLLIQGAPAREQSDIKDQNGNDVGAVSSGTFSPTLKAPIAMGYVKRECAKIGTKLKTVVRGKESEAEVVQLPFVPHRYFLKPKAQ